MSRTVSALKCHTYTDHMWETAKGTNMAATAVKIYFRLSINFFFKSYYLTTQAWHQCEPLSLHCTSTYVKHLRIVIPYCKKWRHQCEVEDIIGVDSGGEVEVETEPITQCTVTPSKFSMWAMSQVNPLRKYMLITKFSHYRFTLRILYVTWVKSVVQRKLTWKC